MRYAKCICCGVALKKKDDAEDVSFKNFCVGVLRKSSKTTVMLLKILIPVSIIVKILEIFGLIEVVASYISGVMGIMGLPGEFSLVWATAMLTNIYGGMVVFFNLVQSGGLYSMREVTVLALIVLVAHALPLEVSIARKAGVRVWFSVLLRVGCAFVFGMVLNYIFVLFNLYSSPALVVWTPQTSDPSLVSWIFGQLRSYVIIFVIISLLMAVMDFLKIVGVLSWLNKKLEPFLELLGMSRQVAPLGIVGLTLGLSYGGGLIIQEAKSGRLQGRDVVLGVSLMNLCHSLIEDSLLMISLGAALSGVFVARFFFSIVVVFVLARILVLSNGRLLRFVYARS